MAPAVSRAVQQCSGDIVKWVCHWHEHTNPVIATPVEDGTLIGRTRGTHKKCAHGKRRVVAPVRPQPVRPAGDADAGEGVEGNREKVGAPRSPEEPGQADNAGEVHEAQVDDHGGVDGSDLLVRDLLDHGGAVVGRASDAAVVSAGTAV